MTYAMAIGSIAYDLSYVWKTNFQTKQGRASIAIGAARSVKENVHFIWSMEIFISPVEITAKE